MPRSEKEIPMDYSPIINAIGVDNLEITKKALAMPKPEDTVKALRTAGISESDTPKISAMLLAVQNSFEGTDLDALWKNDRQLALHVLTATLLTKKCSSKLWQKLGIWFNAIEKKEPALHAFRAMIHFGEANSYTYWHIGILNLELSNYTIATEMLEKAKSLGIEIERTRPFLFLAKSLAGTLNPLDSHDLPELDNDLTKAPVFTSTIFFQILNTSLDRIMNPASIDQSTANILYFHLLLLDKLKKKDSIKFPNIKDMFVLAKLLNDGDKTVLLCENLLRFDNIQGALELFQYIDQKQVITNQNSILRVALELGRFDLVDFSAMTNYEDLSWIKYLDTNDTCNALISYSYQTGHSLASVITKAIKTNTDPEFAQAITKEFERLGAIITISNSNATVSLMADNKSNASGDLPEVTVVVPAYNAEDWLELTLKSLESQTLKNFECILVDDASTDSTQRIFRIFANKDKRFRLVNHRANSGLAASRNSGLRAARAPLICFLDSDDLMMSDGLESRSAVLRLPNSRRVIGTYCGSITIDEKAKTPPASIDIKLPEVDFVSAAGGCPFNANQPMFLTEKLRAFGGFDEQLTQAEDYELWTRILRSGFYFIPTLKTGVTYRKRRGSMVRQDPLGHLSLAARWHKSAQLSVPNNEGQVENVSFNLLKPQSNYAAQMTMFNRVLEFAGMALAKGIKISDIAVIVAKELPDLFVLSNHRNPIDRLRIGIERFFDRPVKELNLWFQNELIRDSSLLISEAIRIAASTSFDNNEDVQSIDTDLIRRPDLQATKQIVFFPHKDYHVWTISLIGKFLNAKNIEFIVCDFSCHYRDEGVRSKALELGISLVGISNFVTGNYKPSVLISFNDWDPIVRSIFLMAQKAGIRTISIVEGVQDYLDSDTGRIREAYRTSDVILTPGKFDERYFVGSRQEIISTGVPRIYALSKENPHPRPQERRALINSNFSYGVLEEHRDQWLASAVAACESAGFKPVISRHPADLGTTFAQIRTKDSFYEALAKSSVLISRFGSGILEALAMQRPVIYFNPHGEKVDKFKDPQGAYAIAESEDQLKNALAGIENDRKDFLEKARSFLAWHAGLGSEDPAKTTAHEIEKAIRNVQLSSKIDYLQFKANLAKIDQRTNAFSILTELRRVSLATYGIEREKFMNVFGSNPMTVFLETGRANFNLPEKLSLKESNERTSTDP